MTVTGATFNEFFTSGFTLTNPTQFAVQVGIKPGQPGKTICSTSGNAKLKVYGEGDVDVGDEIHAGGRPRSSARLAAGVPGTVLRN